LVLFIAPLRRTLKHPSPSYPGPPLLPMMGKRWICNAESRGIRGQQCLEFDTTFLYTFKCELSSNRQPSGRTRACAVTPQSHPLGFAEDSFAIARRSRCGSARGLPDTSLQPFPGEAPQVGQWTVRVCFDLSFFFIMREALFKLGLALGFIVGQRPLLQLCGLSN
jgi:hypothetical protein